MNKTACQNEVVELRWRRGLSYGSLNDLLSWSPLLKNVLRQNRSLFHWPETPESLKYPPPTHSPILYRSGFEPMKESILAPDKPGYWFDKTVGRLQSQRFQHCLHALCILCSMHDETAATRRPAAPHLFLSSFWDSCSGVKTLPLYLSGCV